VAHAQIATEIPDISCHTAAAVGTLADGDRVLGRESMVGSEEPHGVLEGRP